MEMEEKDFLADPFGWGLTTRRILSRLAAQCYDRLGLFLGPITTGLKILVSRSTELVSVTQLDKPIKTVDPEFVTTCCKFLKDLPNLKNLKPHSKALIPKDNQLRGIFSMRDGGVPAYSSIIYLGSTDKENKMTANVCGTKGRVSKRTIPAHEALSAALQAEETRKVASVLSHRPELKNLELNIVMCGDSICVASLYNPKVVMKNVLIKTSVMAVKQKCREIIKLFPKATIKICWMDGKMRRVRTEWYSTR